MTLLTIMVLYGLVLTARNIACKLATRTLLVATTEESYIGEDDGKGKEEGVRGWYERKWKENVRERERKDSERSGAWVEAQTRDDGRRRGVGTGNGERQNRNRNQGAQEHEQTRRRRWRRRRAPIWRKRRIYRKSPRKWNTPSRDGRLQRVSAALPLSPSSFRPTPPFYRNQRSSSGFPDFSSFRRNVVGNDDDENSSNGREGTSRWDSIELAWNCEKNKKRLLGDVLSKRMK